MSLAKAWVFWSNYPDVQAFASVCSHGSGFHPSFAGKRLPDGSFASRHTACYPDSLASAIVSTCEPFMCVGERQIHPAQWRELWLRRLSQPGLLTRLLAGLNSASKDPPLSDADLEPFLSDLRDWLGVSDDVTWRKLREVDSDQPFRLNLWHTFALILKDPDADFFALLSESGLPSWSAKSCFRLTRLTFRPFRSSTVNPPGSRLWTSRPSSMISSRPKCRLDGLNPSSAVILNCVGVSGFRPLGS